MIPLIEEEDKEILMHREVHFGGSFPVMIDYYKNDGKGALLDLHRIEELSRLAEDPAPLLLSQADYEKIAEAQKIYAELRDIYETDNQEAKLIADLILSEEDEQEAVQAVTQEPSLVPHLINLLRTEPFHDPLYPGYGYAPSLAAQCLGEMGDERAIVPLFESLGTSAESSALAALAKLPSKSFLIQALRTHPENAALALSAMPEDPEIAQACFELLQTAYRQIPLSIYLAIACEALPDKAPLKALLDSDLPDHLREIISNI